MVTLKATDNPNVQKDYAELPAMGKTFWDGLPSPDFMESFFNVLSSSLGSISENGSTLLATALRRDAGGIGMQANPHFNVATAQVRSQSANRNKRLFSCILNYINPRSWVYIYVLTNFANDGIAAYQYIRVYGLIAYTDTQIRIFENEWDDLTIASLALRITTMTLFVLAERIHSLARKIRKSNAQMKRKFLEALPTQCAHFKSHYMNDMVHNGYAFPANYPAYYPAHLAGQPHPFAGQPDINSLARKMYSEWIDLIASGAWAKVPKGLLTRTEALDINDPEEDADTLCTPCETSKVTSTTKCRACGGSGHCEVTTLPSGQVVTCASKLLKTTSPNTSSIYSKGNTPTKDKYRKFGRYSRSKSPRRDTKTDEGKRQYMRAYKNSSSKSKYTHSLSDDGSEVSEQTNTESQETSEDKNNGSSDSEEGSDVSVDYIANVSGRANRQ